MKRYLYTILCSTVMVCSVLLVGCVKDQLEDNGKPGDGKTITATFTLSPEIVEEIEVRSVTDVDERLIKDLWVIQLNEAGTAQLQEPQYITSLTAGPRDYKVAVPLVRSASRVYFIANTHDTEAYKGKTTTADVESVTMAVASETSIANADGILMSAVWTGTPDLLGIAGQVSLSRAIAKVNFKLDASLPKGESFLLTSVQIKQVPNKLHGYRDAATTGVFPVTPTVINYDPTRYTKVNLTIANPQALWWYLPENARGTGTATVQGDKASKSPTDQKDYCTYIEIKGDYLLGTGQGFTSTYKIYLGANNTTDYNLNRNTVYNVNTTIKGIDAADTRIENVVLNPLDYTDNGSAWFLIAPYDTQNPVDGSGSMNWYVANGVYDATYNPNTLSACPAGWRMPTHIEASLMWVYKNATSDFALNSSDSFVYWTSTERNITYAFFRSMLSGYAYSHVGPAVKTRLNKLRCVKDAPLGGKYPYVGLNDTGEARVIVSRDANGGVGTNAVRATNWSGQTPLHKEVEPNNNVPAMLEVAKSDCNETNAPRVTQTNNWYTWENAIKACAAYSEAGSSAGSWRLPTQRELILMWVMDSQNGLDTDAFGVNSYRATSYVTAETASIVNFQSQGTDNLYLTTATPVRCVRDVTGAKRPPITVGMFGGWDEAAQEYTKQLQVDWGSANTDPKLTWGPDNETTGAANKEYGPTNITELKKKSADLSLYPAAKYCADKGDGWYLPSQNQLMAIWVTYNGIPADFSFGSSIYWSATECNNTNSWYLYFKDGNTDQSDKNTSSTRVRCVKDVAPQGTEAPQVSSINSRAIIDNRNMPAKAITKERKAQTTDGDNSKLGTNDLNNIGSAESNKTVSYYFEVMKTDLNGGTEMSWLDAVKGCAAYDSGDGSKTWRLPTQRELMLIWTLHKTLIKKTGLTSFVTSRNYWSATESSSSESWSEGFLTGYTTTSTNKIYTYRVRCVRDLTPPAK